MIVNDYFLWSWITAQRWPHDGERRSTPPAKRADNPKNSRVVWCPRIQSRTSSKKIELAYEPKFAATVTTRWLDPVDYQNRLNHLSQQSGSLLVFYHRPRIQGWCQHWSHPQNKDIGPLVEVASQKFILYDPKYQKNKTGDYPVLSHRLRVIDYPKKSVSNNVPEI